ncbi:MAG TPA: DNA polymerase III subunit alpha, partial [Ktedonobacteraceae bacterium]|nr:DNA polymerase III subunit alpha [Ktedonobacteraceae bacterium]
IFPRAYEQNPELWAVNNVLLVTGEVQIRNDEPTILCDKAEMFEGLEEEINRQQYDVWIVMQLSGEDERSVSNDKIRVQDLYNCIHNQPGRDHYQILVMNGEWQVRLTPSDNTMRYSSQVHSKLVDILRGLGEVKAQLVER